MRAQRAGNGRRSADQVDGYLSAQIDSGQIVILHLGYDQPVADKHERGRDALRRLGAHAHAAVFAEGERLTPAIPYEREPGMLLHDPARAQLDWLHVARA